MDKAYHIRASDTLYVFYEIKQSSYVIIENYKFQ